LALSKTRCRLPTDELGLEQASGLWKVRKEKPTHNPDADPPDDPANNYLLHYATESAEVINFYRGTVTLDGAGEAVVELPHYFAKINKTPSYQLTAVGAPMPMLHVAEEIDEAALSAGATAGAGVAAPACTFRIAAGPPGAKVSWEVKAVRNDLWVQNRAGPWRSRSRASRRARTSTPSSTACQRRWA